MTKPLKDINEKKWRGRCKLQEAFLLHIFILCICKATDSECLGWEPQWMDILCIPGPLLCSHAGLPGFSRESITVHWLAAVADAHSHGVLSAAESCFLSRAELVCMSAAAHL